MPSRFGSTDGAAQKSRTVQRRESKPWRAWYSTARWQKLSLKVRVAANFTCVRCHRLAIGKGQSIADHKIPHRGDAALFWDEGNLQCLCKACHDGAKQREESAGLHG
ncbi:hypothetical protein DL1_11885 [Thioclava dalianensis]|uniref:Putative HNH nuclease YajD n=1 Tax=Thioclava dalianensis TaxID=1185766 RepID=A0A074THA5_9RHOB|nr:HNH endonuclease [Thioclava dalianensis]KEP68408.1 hypothetical protein DL1_11885 [Thioclava dalianensis]SFN62368.1 HNH endonuclease [Thioclava dalianensis]